ACAGQEMRALVEDLACGRQRSALSGCDAARCAGAARVGHHAQGPRMMRGYLSGPFTALGLAAAIFACAIDQAVKLWLIFSYELGRRGAVTLTPFLDIVLTWNTGISYGWFKQDGPVGQWVLLAFKVVAVSFLWVWLARATSRLSAVSLGLII